MKLSIKLLCFLFICSPFFGYTQGSEPIIINNNNRSIYNPAFAGIEYGKHVTSLGYRSSINQSSSYPEGIFSNGFDFNGNSKKLYSGFGANISHNFNQFSTRNSRLVFPNSGFKHYTSKNHDLNVKLNYNCKLNVGENSVFALGTSVGMMFVNTKNVYENSNEKTSNNSISSPILSFGTSYSNKNFFIGLSVGDIFTLNDGLLDIRPYISLNTGYNWIINNRLSIEPSIFIKNSANPSIIMLQNNFVFLQKYNLGGGFSKSYLRHGFHVFGGIQIKEKLRLNLAYKKINHQLYRESQAYWLKGAGLELNVSYQFN